MWDHYRLKEILFSKGYSDVFDLKHKQQQRQQQQQQHIYTTVAGLRKSVLSAAYGGGDSRPTGAAPFNLLACTIYFLVGSLIYLVGALISLLLNPLLV